MINSFKKLLIACCFISALGTSYSAFSQPIQFRIYNIKHNREISETSRIYINEKLIATFTLDEKHHRILLPIVIDSEQKSYRYDFCGEIKIRNDDDKIETHEINSTGWLHNPKGRIYYALAEDNFTYFYLGDLLDPSAANHTNQRSTLCSIPAS